MKKKEKEKLLPQTEEEEGKGGRGRGRGWRRGGYMHGRGGRGRGWQSRPYTQTVSVTNKYYYYVIFTKREQRLYKNITINCKNYNNY